VQINHQRLSVRTIVAIAAKPSDGR